MMFMNAVFTRLRAGLALSALVLVLPSAPVMAEEAMPHLRAFIDNAQTVQGRFEQVVVAASGRKPQHATGEFVFQRPGRFHWEYTEPYPQVLVSDGNRLWSWDPDLNQVTIQELGDALGSTPAAILSGDDALERNFELAEGGRHDGFVWVEATPRQTDSTFEVVRIGFAGGRLERMEMRDHFGQTTVIDFYDLELGADVDAGRFEFTPPPGADVMGG